MGRASDLQHRAKFEESYPLSMNFLFDIVAFSTMLWFIDDKTDLAATLTFAEGPNFSIGFCLIAF
jgi:hypothetical protein